MAFEDAGPPGPAPRAGRPGGRGVAVAFFALLIAGAAAMTFSRFLPSPLGVRVSQIAGGVTGAYAAWECREGGLYSAANPRFAAYARAHWLTRNIWARMPLMGLFVFTCTFAAVECGALALWTAASGQPASRTLTVTGTGGGGRSCRHFLVREEGFLLDRALCAPGDLLAQAQRGRQLTASGKGSAFGINVTSLSLGPPA